MQAPIPSSHLLSYVKKYVIAHKIMSGIIAAIVVFGGYWVYGKFHPTIVPIRYVLSNVATGTVISVVSGSGQVSASNQVDIRPKVSGEITSANVREGQYVAQGAAIAYIDATSAQKAVRDAQANLQSAQIALQKLQEPADTLSLTQAQNASDNAKSNLASAYDSAFNQVSGTFLDMPTVMNGLNTILFSYDRTLGGSNQQNIDYYTNAIALHDTTSTFEATQFHDDAAAKYNAAKSSFDAIFSEYKNTSRTADPATTEKLLNDTYKMTQTIFDATKAINNLVQKYQDVYAANNLTPNPTSNTHLSTLGTYTSTINTHLSTLSSSVTSISSGKQNVTETSQSLQKVQSGPDSLDVQSSQLSVTQRQNALTDAQETLADYTIRAPFSGTLAKLDIQRGDNVSSGTTVATLITTQEIAELSLNEIDATKVKIDQKATLTFDAIDGLSVTGKVVSIDSLGTVTQGVVSYTVKIGFDTQDVRVKPGMTVNADIQTGIAQNVLTVPAGAVKTANGSSYVQVFSPALPDSGGTTGTLSANAPVNVPVTIGISDGTKTQILSGLSAGQQIVTRTISGSSSTVAPTTGGNARGGLGGIRL